MLAAEATLLNADVAELRREEIADCWLCTEDNADTAEESCEETEEGRVELEVVLSEEEVELVDSLLVWLEDDENSANSRLGN